MLNKLITNSFNLLYSKNEIIKLTDNKQKNISEQLLTIRTLIISEQPPSPEEADQLAKILSACRLLPDQYCTIYLPVSWTQLRTYSNIQEVILFGVTEQLLDLPVLFAENKGVHFDERTWIKTAAIAVLMQSKELKNALWQNALKPHFLP